MDLSNYKRTVLATTDRVKIVLMLYEGALNNLRMAKKKMSMGDVVSKGLYLGKATNIVTELSNVLDMEKGGEIAGNLRALYDFVLRRLLHANLKNDLKAVEEAERVIEIIKDGWKEMMQGMNQKSENTTYNQVQAGV